MSVLTGQSAPTDHMTTPAALPPWMLLWLIGFAVSVPATAQYWRQYSADLTGSGAYRADVVNRPSFILLRLDAMVQFVPHPRAGDRAARGRVAVGTGGDRRTPARAHRATTTGHPPH